LLIEKNKRVQGQDFLPISDLNSLSKTLGLLLKSQVPVSISLLLLIIEIVMDARLIQYNTISQAERE